MKNTIYIYPTGHTKVVTENGDNSIIIRFEKASPDATIELLKGNEWYSELKCRHINGKASATVPKETLTGSNLHFRLKDENGFSEYFHIVYDKKKPLSLLTLGTVNRVIFGNIAGINPSQNYNTYKDLSAFTNDELSAYTYKELRERSL